MKPIGFYYMRKSQIEGVEKMPSHSSICLSTRRERYDEVIRVAVVPVDMSIIDKAFDEMSESEKRLLSPDYHGGGIANASEIRALADFMRDQARAAIGAADKLQKAADAVERETT